MYLNETGTASRNQVPRKRLSVMERELKYDMERELKYEAQEQELSAVGLSVGLSMLLLIGLGVVVALVLLALT